MSLLNEDLSIWEIGFRWAKYDPDKYRVCLPLLVRDNFRVLMDAVLSSHLQCDTMSTDKYHGDDATEAQFYIRYWLDPVYACIEGREFNKKMLKWAHIDRYSFQQWCHRRTIPLPEFWFPHGWALDYQWEDESLIARATNDLSETSESTTSSANSIQDAESVKNELEPVKANSQTHEEKDAKLRSNQRRRIAVEVVADNLWKTHPEMTMTEMLKHSVIQDQCGGKFQAEEVVRKWLRGIAPPEVKKRVGRPRSKKDTGDK